MRPAAWAWSVLCLACAVAAACKPWTVRPIDDASTDGRRTSAFDAPAYVTGIWESKVLTAIDQSAEDVAAVLSGPRRSVLVKGRARVTRVDRRSRVGLAYLDAGTADTRVALLLGPVLRGSALRDALTFIRFSDFVNQIDYASVASALNDRALAATASLDRDALEGRVVSFRGAAAVTGPGQATVEIVPVALQVSADR